MFIYIHFSVKYSSKKDHASYVYILTNNYKLSTHNTPIEETEYYYYCRNLLCILP